MMPDTDSLSSFAQLRQRLAEWLRTYRPAPRTYITAACVGATVGQYAAIAGSTEPTAIAAAIAALGAQLGVNLLADIIGSRPVPPALTVEQISEAVQARLEAGDDLPAVRVLIREFDLIQLAMETWEGADDTRFQQLRAELAAHPQLLAKEVLDALDPRLAGIERTTGEILRIVRQTSSSDSTQILPREDDSRSPPKIAPNPFGDVGRLTDPARFWDREELLRRIFEELDKSVNLSLVGEAQVGKSSVLSMIRLYGQQRVQRTVDDFIYLSLEEVDDEDEFYVALCYSLRIDTCRGFALTHALRGRRYVLCIDEGEKLYWEQFGFTRKMRSHLRGLADGIDEPFTLVVASRSPLALLTSDSPELDSPLAGICHQINVDPFSYREACAFLGQRLHATGIVFTPAHIDGLFAQSGGHPGRLQRAAADLYRQISQSE